MSNSNAPLTGADEAGASGEGPFNYQSISASENVADLEIESGEDLSVNISSMEIGSMPSSDHADNAQYSSAFIGPSSIFYMVLLVAVSTVAGGFYQLFTQQSIHLQSIHDLNKRLDSYQHSSQEKLHTIQTNLQTFSDHTDSREHEMKETVDSHNSKIEYLDTIVERLNNRTTNADVLDKLHSTHVALHEEMKNTTEEVEHKLHKATAGIRYVDNVNMHEYVS